MIQIGSFLYISDNSGVKKIKSIQNLTRKTNKIFLGDLIVGVVKQTHIYSKIICSSIVYSIVIRTKKNNYKNKEYKFCFNDNSSVIVDRNLNLIGSRVLGSIPKYLKEKNFLKLHTLSLDFI